MSYGLIYTWALGERKAVEMLKRVNGGGEPSRVECMMRLGESVAELHYDKAPGDEWYKDYWLLYMPATREQAKPIYCVSDLRTRAIEELRNGRARLLGEWHRGNPVGRRGWLAA